MLFGGEALSLVFSDNKCYLEFIVSQFYIADACILIFCINFTARLHISVISFFIIYIEKHE